MTNSTGERLETLQERYPHGSRWDLCPPGQYPLQGIPLDRTSASHDAVVCGWIDRWTEGGVVFDLGGGVFFAVTTADVDQSCIRLVPPPPCPITEPVTLRMYPGPYWCEVGRPGGADLGHIPPITLHPPGPFDVLQSAEEYGIYTWGET